MKITPVNCNISFQRIQMKDNKGIKIFDNLKCSSDSRNFDEQNVSINPFARYNYNNYRIEFKNKKRGLTAQENIGLYPWTDYLFINNMDSFYERCGLGTCMHLINIIEMLENKIKNFKITSKDSAIYFHSKYKFEPAVTSFEDRKKLLQTIVNDRSNGFEDLSLTAQRLNKYFQNRISWQSQQEFQKQTNKLLQEYIKRALDKKEIDKHSFKWTMDMCLTEENVRKNRDFFNGLFKKHGIDYTI